MPPPTDDFGGVSEGFKQKLHLFVPAALVAIVILRMLLPALSEEPPFGVTFDETGDQIERIRDFPVVLEMVRALWSTRPGMLEREPRVGYRTDGQLQVASAWLGRPAPSSLLFLHTPTMFWLWGPLTPLSNPWAYIAWSMVSLTAVFWLTRPTRSPPALGPLVFLSIPASLCLLLGQTALVSSALLLYLARDCLDGRAPGRSRNWGPTLALWILTIKPQLALAAGVALLVCGHWRTVISAFGLTLVSTLALLPWLGVDWVPDYLALLASNNVEDIAPAFAGTLNIASMSNLRAMLHVDFGVRDALASGIASAALISSLLVLGGLGFKLRLPPAPVWSSAILAVLLLTPHVNSYQKILLYLVFALSWSAHTPEQRWARHLIAALVLGWLWLPSVLAAAQATAHAIPPWIGVAVKTTLVVLVWVGRGNGRPLRH
jgi:hypothetical protein